MAALPGIKTEILDKHYNAGRTDLPGGPLIAVVAKSGLAEATPTTSLIAFYPANEREVIDLYGENSQLHRAYYELTTTGASRIVLIPLPVDTVFNQSNATISSSTINTPDLFGDVMDVVESTRADLVVLWGRGSDSTDWDNYYTPATPGNDTTDFFYADNNSSPSSSWVGKLAAECANITSESHPIHGVIGVKPIAGSEDPSVSQVSAGLAFSNLPDREDPTLTNGHFVSVVATEIRPLGSPSSWGWSNGACAYAALISRLPAQDATTNMPVYNVDRIRYNPTRVQAEALIDKGVVPVRLNTFRAPRWVDGTTFAAPTSDYVRLTTFRITVDVIKLIRNIGEAYVGKGMTLERRHSFETQISSALTAMQKVQAIRSSDSRVLYIPSENKAIINVAITPAFELREIYLELAVNFG